MNGGWDKFSIPKRVAKDLIAMHQQRGDTIYFITGRPATEGEKVTEILQKNFAIKQMHPVLFAGNLDKVKEMKKLGIELYYGDSDADITSAMEVGARPIRVMRATNSSYYPLPKNGAYGEEVLVNSDV